MSRTNRAYTTSEYCQSHDFNNLYIVDGTTFPFLPSKNITFTLMANAVRVASAHFRPHEGLAIKARFSLSR